jgi:hypothetical protein
MEDEAPQRPGATEDDRPGRARLWPVAALLGALTLARAFGLERHIRIG